jgi:hypothetical protein
MDMVMVLACYSYWWEFELLGQYKNPITLKKIVHCCATLSVKSTSYKKKKRIPPNRKEKRGKIPNA